MADRRIEDEIEEILAKLDVGESGDTITGEKEPISFEKRRKAKQPGLLSRITEPFAGMTEGLTPATVLFGGAGIMLAGLILSAFVDALIWLAFAGVVLFIVAFVWSFMRKAPAGAPRGAGPAGGGGPKRVFWRDRYIEYDPEGSNAVNRIRRRFRKR